MFVGAIALLHPVGRVRVRATVKLSAVFLHNESSVVTKAKGSEGRGGGYESAIAPVHFYQEVPSYHYFVIVLSLIFITCVLSWFFTKTFLAHHCNKSTKLEEKKKKHLTMNNVAKKKKYGAINIIKQFS